MNQNPVTATNSLEINASGEFAPWLLEQNLSLAFSTYQAGKLFFIRLQLSGKLSVFERTFERCMGLYASGSTLYMSSLYQLWRFALKTSYNRDKFTTTMMPFTCPR
ncbi:TIGR03032 family protein [Desmonostoc muscorum LEGE 12446]|uniref:DUF4915 domain-containing protein n=1 Tax=Desmonostoc muscorum TaxID=1179 RepID=UPI001D14E49B|nr:DUF4915 domain-containing protein [Desmonostoc muscorum]MCF2150953.1 TIGR03032 family protein [Desmonostoc muscorum LEGE 12446]